jgi:putative acetyltransferase
MIDEVRGSGRYLPGLSLVAEAGGRKAGHLMLSLAEVECPGGKEPPRPLLLGPVCVREDLRGRGAGSTLIRDGLARAKNMGHQAVFLLGDQGYHKRLGFATAREFGISIRLLVAADQVPETLEKIFPDALVAIFPK